VEETKCVLVIWSKKSIQSDWVINEAMEGKERDILVPVLIDKVKSPIQFRHIQTANIIDWQGSIDDSALVQILEAIAAIVGTPNNDPNLPSLMGQVGNISKAAQVQIRVHTAFFENSPTRCYFINVVNTSSGDNVELTHVWFEGSKRVDVLEPCRPLPTMLKPQQSWETWIAVSEIPPDHEVFKSFRVRTSTGEILESEKNRNVPPAGFVPGGSV